MMQETCSPRTLSLGELFLSLLKALLQPLGLFTALPLMLILPGLGASYYYEVQKNQQGHFLRAGFGFIKSVSWSLVLKIEALYLIMLFAFAKYYAYRAGILFQIYEKAAASHQVLQIATPEQQAYAKGIYLLLYLGLVLVFTFYILTFTYVSQHLYVREMKLNQEATKPIYNNFKNVLRAVFYNLHLYLILLLILTVLVSLIEAHFSRFKLIYIESIILNTQAFNPVIPFIILRIILLNVIIGAISLTTLRSLSLIPKISFKNQ